MNTEQIIAALKMQTSGQRGNMFAAIKDVRPTPLERFINDPKGEPLPDDAMHMLADWFDGLYAMSNSTGEWVRTERTAATPVALGVRPPLQGRAKKEYPVGEGNTGVTVTQLGVRPPTDAEEAKARREIAAKAEIESHKKKSLLERAFPPAQTVPLGAAIPQRP